MVACSIVTSCAGADKPSVTIAAFRDLQWNLWSRTVTSSCANPRCTVHDVRQQPISLFTLAMATFEKLNSSIVSKI